MSCVLYREGKGHIENGHECEITTCEPHDLQNYLDSGWQTTPPGVDEQPQLAPESPEVYQNPEIEPNVIGEPEPLLADPDYEVRDVEVEEPEEDPDEEPEPNDGTLASPDEVRQQAKDAGISGWDTKRVKTLRKELEKR